MPPRSHFSDTRRHSKSDDTLAKDIRCDALPQSSIHLWATPTQAEASAARPPTKVVNENIVKHGRSTLHLWA